MGLFSRKDKPSSQPRCLWLSGQKPCRNGAEPYRIERLFEPSSPGNHKGLCRSHYQVRLTKLH